MSDLDLAERVKQLEETTARLSRDLKDESGAGLYAQAQFLAAMELILELSTKFAGADRKAITKRLGESTAIHFERLLLRIGDTDPDLAESLDLETLQKLYGADDTAG